MQSGRISVRYARALYDFSFSQNSLNEVYSNSYFISNLLENSKELTNLLTNPVVSISEKERIISEILQNKIHKTLFDLIKLMVRKNREGYIQNCLLIFRKIYRQEQGVYSVLVETPNELSTDFENKIIEFVNRRFNKKSELNVKVRPELIGGFILQVEDQMIDQSVLGQLNVFKKTLIPGKKVI